VHKYVRLTDIMHPATLHGVGVITKLYFAIFAAFKESCSDLESRSELIQGHRFWYQSKARIHIPLFLLVVNVSLVNRKLDLILQLAPFQRYDGMSKMDNFPYPTPIPAKNLGVFPLE